MSTTHNKKEDIAMQNISSIFEIAFEKNPQVPKDKVIHFTIRIMSKISNNDLVSVMTS